MVNYRNENWLQENRKKNTIRSFFLFDTWREVFDTVKEVLGGVKQVLGGVGTQHLCAL